MLGACSRAFTVFISNTNWYVLKNENKLSFRCGTTEHTASQIAKFMGPTWGPPGSCRTQMAPLSAPWTLLLGMILQKTTMSDFERIAAKQIQQFSRILDDKVLDSLKGLL